MVEVPVLLADLRGAHAFLARVAKATVPKLAGPSEERWGIEAKRSKVRLNGDRPKLVHDAEPEHSFAEVMNQCATLERLIDVTEWIATQADFADYRVEICHPTTSSSNPKGGALDNDLVLVSADGARACFEVSDVASDKDGNKKLLSELISLGILAKKEGTPPSWPSARVFVVVSDEFAKYVRGRSPAPYRFREAGSIADTVIFEVVQGHAPVG